MTADRAGLQRPLGPSAAAVAGALLVVISTASVQGSAALASTLFDRASPLAVSGLRQAFGAAALLVMLRPRIRSRPAGQWVAIGTLAVAIAAMNSLYYQAVSLLPLGVAATLLYLGPFALAARRTPRGPEMLLPVVVLIGVYLTTGVAGVEGSGTVALLVGLAAAAALALYTLAAQRLGETQGLDSLALAIAGSAILLMPASLPAVASLHASDIWVLLAAGSVGVALTFGADFLALQISNLRLVSVLFALDPVMGVLIGTAFLSEPLEAGMLIGVALVVICGGIVTAITARTQDADPDVPGSA